MMNPYLIIGGLLLLIAVAFGGAQVGRKLERTAWQQKEIATAAQNQKELNDAIQAAQRQELFNQAKARKATEDHVQAINDLNQKYAAALIAVKSAGGLRVNRAAVCDSTTASNQGTSTSGSHETSAGTVELPQSTQASLFELVKRADELAEQLRALQGWIKDNGFDGP